MPRDGGPPSLRQREHDRDQSGPDKQAQEAKCDKPAKDAQNRQGHRHFDAEADEPRLDEVVDSADQNAPDDRRKKFPPLSLEGICAITAPDDQPCLVGSPPLCTRPSD